MNKGAVIFAGLFSLISIAGYVVAAITKFWRITTYGITNLIKLVKFNDGLFQKACINTDCSDIDAEKFLSSDDNASKVAAAGVILAALLALVAGIVLVFSACGKGSGGPKIGGSLLIFAVIFVVAGITTYIVLSLQQASPLASVTFGYSLYIASAAGAMDLIAAIAAFAGA